METNVTQILKNCTVEGMTVKLPAGQLERSLYQKVAKSLELIGGKWKSGKVMGFVFPACPKKLLEQISGGEVVNIKKEFQFFETPSNLADQLVSLADLHDNHSVLEPSAGQGAIIKAIHRIYPYKEVDCYEAMSLNQDVLRGMSYVMLRGDDFLNTGKPHQQYDRIIANPPFRNNQDIHHIKEMYKKLKPGGVLVSISSIHWQFASGKKEVGFRAWLDKVEAKTFDVDAEAFKESGTMIKTAIIKIKKI